MLSEDDTDGELVSDEAREREAIAEGDALSVAVGDTDDESDAKDGVLMPEMLAGEEGDGTLLADSVADKLSGGVEVADRVGRGLSLTDVEALAEGVFVVVPVSVMDSNEVEEGVLVSKDEAVADKEADGEPEKDASAETETEKELEGEPVGLTLAAEETLGLCEAGMETDELRESEPEGESVDELLGE